MLQELDFLWSWKSTWWCRDFSTGATLRWKFFEDFWPPSLTSLLLIYINLCSIVDVWLTHSLSLRVNEVNGCPLPPHPFFNAKLQLSNDLVHIIRISKPYHQTKATLIFFTFRQLFLWGFYNILGQNFLI